MPSAPERGDLSASSLTSSPGGAAIGGQTPVADAMPWLDDASRIFRMAFDDAPVGMIIASPVGEPGNDAMFLHVNVAFARMLGGSPAELVGRSFADLVHPDDLTVDHAQVADLVTGVCARSPRREMRMRRVDGSWLWVRIATTVVEHDGPAAHVIAHVEDVTARRAAETELARRALYDPLTGLANRTLLLDHLEMAILELGRERAALAVFYLDLDRFKDVNDSLGHDAGDEVLRQVGARLIRAVRPPDTAARLAGDEFVVAARVRDDVQAARIAERLYGVISAPMSVRNRQLVVRPSIGVTTTSSMQALPEDLLREADLAMYQAKRRRCLPWAVYDEALHRLALERLAVEESLRAALSEDRLRLHYQPIIDLADGRIVSVEALLRLEDERRGLLCPDSFIGIAEDSDLIVPIGAWVLEEACRQLALWQRRWPDVQLAVNVSARQVSRLAVQAQVMAATFAAGIDPSCLLLEITERVFVDATSEVVEELRQVAAVGCALAIDDFGSGCSSLAYLKRFPIRSVKIDRSFVAGLCQPGEDAAIVEALSGLARALRLTVVGEGVESPEQLATLHRLGCHQAQGYHIARPVPAAVMGKLLAAQ
jgi:diguanylate cyclase (GGDEF)-like protein/PAS domain S-box-containing protein